MSGFHWSIWEFSVWPLLCFCRRWIEIVLTIALSLKVTIIAFIIKHSDNHREIRQSSSSLSLLRQSTQDIQQKMFVLAHRLFISAISFLFFPHISTKPSPPDSWLRRCFCITPTLPHFFVPDQLFIWTKTFQKTFFKIWIQMDVDGCALHQLPPRHLVADQSFCPHSEAALGVRRIVQFVQYLDKSVQVCSGRSVHRKPCHVFCAVCDIHCSVLLRLFVLPRVQNMQQHVAAYRDRQHQHSQTFLGELDPCSEFWSISPKTLEINQRFHFNSVPFGCYQRKQMCNEASSLRKHMRTLLILIPQSFRGPACCRP